MSKRVFCDQSYTRSVFHWSTRPRLCNSANSFGAYMKLQFQYAARATINKTTMRRYNTVRSAQWRRFVAFIKATKQRHHWAITRSDRHQLDTPTPVVSSSTSSS